jgi:gas vesicle protein
MSKVEAEDVGILLDKAWQQFKEDREAVMEQYADLKAYIAANNERYAISGDTLAKYAELMIKQTSQIVELVKLAKKETQGDASFNEDDLKHINEQIDAESKKETEPEESEEK